MECARSDPLDVIIKNANSHHAYNYTMNNPIIMIDPSGLEEQNIQNVTEYVFEKGSTVTGSNEWDIAFRDDIPEQEINDAIKFGTLPKQLNNKACGGLANITRAYGYNNVTGKSVAIWGAESPEQVSEILHYYDVLNQNVVGIISDIAIVKGSGNKANDVSRRIGNFAVLSKKKVNFESVMHESVSHSILREPNSSFYKNLLKSVNSVKGFSSLQKKFNNAYPNRKNKENELFADLFQKAASYRAGKPKSFLYFLGGFFKPPTGVKNKNKWKRDQWNSLSLEQKAETKQMAKDVLNILNPFFTEKK